MPKLTDISPEKALARCEALCARSEQSSGDIAAKLRQWGIASGDVRAIIDSLRANGYIDDKRYSRAYVRTKFQFSGWGRLKIAYNLRAKLVDEEFIGQAIEEIDDDEYRTKAEAVLKAKYREVKSRPAIMARAALLRFAAQRGFEADISIPIVNRIIGSQEDE